MSGSAAIVSQPLELALAVGFSLRKEINYEELYSTDRRSDGASANGLAEAMANRERALIKSVDLKNRCI